MVGGVWVGKGAAKLGRGVVINVEAKAPWKS